MNWTIQRLGMLVLAGWCLAGSSTLSAQTPGYVAVTPEVVVVSGGAGSLYTAQPGRPVHNAFNEHGVCCGGDPDQLGCRNFHSYMVFMFGSCRTFFGEPCQLKPPHFGQAGGNANGTPNGGQKCCSN